MSDAGPTLEQTVTVKVETSGVRGLGGFLGRRRAAEQTVTGRIAANRRLVTANRMLSATLLVFALLGSVGMFWVGQRVAALGEAIQPSAAEEKRRLVAQMRADEQVAAVSAGLATEIGADRVVVNLAHNGKTDLSGLVPFMFMSTVHIHLRPGLAWEERWSRPVPLSVFTPLLRRMIQEGTDGEPSACLQFDVASAELSGALRSQMVDRGSEVVFVCPLRAGPARSGVTGLLVAEFLHRDRIKPADAAMTIKIRAAAAQVHAAMLGD